MRWTSFREDIIDRLNDDLLNLQSSVDSGLKIFSDAPSFHHKNCLDARSVWVDAQTMLARARHALQELTNDLDVATDPSLQLSARIIELERENARLKQDLRTATDRADQSSKRQSNVEAKADLLRQQLKEAEKRNRQLAEKLTEAMTIRPESIYDAYSSPELIRKGKPNV